MKRLLVSSLAALLAFAAAVLPAALPGTMSRAAPLRAETLNIYNWSDFIDPSVIEDFEREYGIDVVYDTYDSGETTESMIISGDSGYDLAVVSSEYVGRLIAAEAIRPIDHALLSNIGNLWPEVMARAAVHDPGGRFTIPYLWGTTGIGYDANAIAARMPDAPVDSWAMLFDPQIVKRFADCGVTMVDAPEEVLSAALAYLGRDPGSSDPDDIAAALEAIAGVAHYVRSFDSAHIKDLASGRSCLSLGWSGDVLAAADEAAGGIDVRYATPVEGAPIWFDMFVMPHDAARPDAAHLFLDFILRPDVIARCTNALWYPNPNAAATALVDREVLDHPAVYPPAGALEGLFALRTRPAKIKRSISRSWNRIKIGL